MIWNSPKDRQTPCRLYIGGTLVATIKKKGSGRTPFYFSQKNDIIKYNGGFGSLKTAKRHVEKKLKAFAAEVVAQSKKRSAAADPSKQAN